VIPNKIRRRRKHCQYNVHSLRV